MTPTKKLTKPGKEKLVKDIIKLLKSIECYESIVIFWNGKRIHVGGRPYNKDAKDDEPMFLDPKEELSEINPKTGEPWKASDYDQYANDNTVSLIFDGSPLYSAMNGEFGWDTQNKFDEGMDILLKPYGLYYEQGYAWSLSLFES